MVSLKYRLLIPQFIKSKRHSLKENGIILLLVKLMKLSLKLYFFIVQWNFQKKKNHFAYFTQNFTLFPHTSIYIINIDEKMEQN